MGTLPSPGNSPNTSPSVALPRTIKPGLCEATPPYSTADFHARKLERKQSGRFDWEFLILLVLTRLLMLPSPGATCLQKFVRTVLARSKVSDSVFCISIVYLFYLYHIKLQSQHGVGDVCHLSICKCWLSCLILASKYYEDCNYSLKAWSSLTGLSVRELRHNELKVLDTLHFQLGVSPTLIGYLFGSKLSNLASPELPSESLNVKPATCALYRATLARLRSAIRSGMSHATRRRETAVRKSKGLSSRSRPTLLFSAL